jgi:putative effector of murein hydrolase LrgA (UPF0299 family)
MDHASGSEHRSIIIFVVAIAAIVILMFVTGLADDSRHQRDKGQHRGSQPEATS